MKYLKMLGLAAVAAMAMTAFTAGSASATTLEVGGTAKNESVTLSASIASGTSAVLSRTDDSLANTCTTSNVHGSTTTFTGSAVKGPISTLSFENCDHNVTVHKPGSLSVTHAGGTDGTVVSEGAEVTVTTAFGFVVNCKTGSGVDIGTLKGVASGHATMNINAVLNCGFLLPSAKWAGTYTVTSPTGIGVVA